MLCFNSSVMEQEKNLSPDIPLGFSLSILAKMYYGAFSRYMEDLYELDKHYSVLFMLHDSDNKCTQQCISKKLHIDKVMMVRNIDYLADKGYIRRITNPEDRRENWVELTAKARKEVPMMKASLEAFNKIAFKGMSTEEVSRFFSSMNTVYHNVENLPASPVTIKYNKKSKK